MVRSGLKTLLRNGAITCIFGGLLILASCQCGPAPYTRILHDMEYSYTTNDTLIQSNIVCMGYTRAQVRTDSLKYRRGLEAFYRADVKIVDYLMTFREDTTSYSSWYGDLNSCSAKIDTHDLVSKSKAALVLLDNYLLNQRHDTLTVPPYIDKMDYAMLIDQISEATSKRLMVQKYIAYIDQITE